MFTTKASHFLHIGTKNKSKPASRQKIGRQLKALFGGASVALALAGCNTVTADQYEASALTTYTWQVEYSINPTGDKTPRRERFASTSSLNRNGQKPQNAVTGPDDKGLWWPALPPKPTLDEIEKRLQQPLEKASSPQLQKTVEYKMIYLEGGQTITLPTNYEVYRQVVKAYPSRTPLQLTLGVNDGSVEKAEPQ